MAHGTSQLIFQAMKNSGAHQTLNNPYRTPPNINYQPNVSLDAQVANANTAFNAPINRALPAKAPIPMKYNYKPTL